MEQVTGYVEKIVFRNADNGYTVLGLSTDDGDVTCVGVFPSISEGERIEIEGEYVIHPSYGVQLQVNRYRAVAPGDKVSAERYLGSGAVKGVGPKMAARIVAAFGDDTFRIIEEEPERLAEVKGISERGAMEIAQQVEEKRELREAMIYLQQYGISLNLAVKIHARYGLDTYRILQENPYQLADDIAGVGFRIADEIARRVGIRMDSDFRIKSGVLYVLQQAAGEGHTYLPEELLTAQVCELLGVEAEAVKKHYTDLAIEKKLVLKQEDGDCRSMPPSTTIWKRTWPPG